LTLFYIIKILYLPQNKSPPKKISDYAPGEEQTSLAELSTTGLNNLPQHVIDAMTVNTFKNRLDKFWKDMGVYG